MRALTEFAAHPGRQRNGRFAEPIAQPVCCFQSLFPTLVVLLAHQVHLRRFVLEA